MRIVLLYPPPWKIPAAGESPDAVGGPPRAHESIEIVGDFCTAPYGLLSLAAQAGRAGHEVKTLNLSTFAWREVEGLIRKLPADLYGLSCLTANRRGAALLAECIRRFHPKAHIVVGGPHVTGLPEETLRHCAAIDTVVIGEGEETFLELIGRLQAGKPTGQLAGTAWRDGQDVRVAPPRPQIADLDALASPHDHFPSPLLLTSRGCPGRCTFCASYAMWGGKLRFHSVDHVLDALAAILERIPVKVVAIKDDTFTADRKRALHICEGIRRRGLNFLWSCDTRVDALDEELLRAMRWAGCQRLSIGVESASPEILRNIKKRVAPEKVLEVTRAARRFGHHIRYYMMAGNRGETLETFHESLRFLQEAKPNEVIFYTLSFYPGTEEFQIHQQKGLLRRDIFFQTDAMEIQAFADAPRPVVREISRWLQQHSGLQQFWAEGVAECKAALDELPDLHAAHVDLAAAYYREGQLEPAEQHFHRALELDYPLPGIPYNYLACIAARRGDLQGLQEHLARAVSYRPSQHSTIRKNAESFTGWLEAGGPKGSRALELTARHELELTMALSQPVKPGALPEGVEAWSGSEG